MTDRKRARLLLVDDEPMMGTALRVAFDADYEVSLVESGEAACRLIESEEPFDAVVCDLMMPGLSGMGLYRWVRGRDPDLADRIVFVTGGAYTREAQAFLAEVDNPRLQKPFSLDALVELVDAVVRGSAPRVVPSRARR